MNPCCDGRRMCLDCVAAPKPIVIPAHAGIHLDLAGTACIRKWVPAFAGTTGESRGKKGDPPGRPHSGLCMNGYAHDVLVRCGTGK